MFVHSLIGVFPRRQQTRWLYGRSGTENIHRRDPAEVHAYTLTQRRFATPGLVNGRGLIEVDVPVWICVDMNELWASAYM